jgi:hypothetical protein
VKIKLKLLVVKPLNGALAPTASRNNLSKGECKTIKKQPASSNQQQMTTKSSSKRIYSDEDELEEEDVSFE